VRSDETAFLRYGPAECRYRGRRRRRRLGALVVSTRRREDHSASRQYVSDEAIGYEVSLNTVDGATHRLRHDLFRAPRWWDGRRIVTVTGLTLRLGATPWVTMEPWALHVPLRSLGSRSAVHGLGALPAGSGGRGVCAARYAPALVAWGVGLMWRSVLRWVAAPPWDGSLVRVKCTCFLPR